MMTALVAGCVPAEPPERASHPLTVRAIGEDFNWRFVYAGRDGALDTSDDRTSDRLLRVPVGSRVELRLASRDYVYLFNADSLGAREIAAPGLDFGVGFSVADPGTYPLPADPLCGLSALHDEQMGRIEAVSRVEFDRWVSNLRPDS